MIKVLKFVLIFLRLYWQIDKRKGYWKITTEISEFTATYIKNRLGLGVPILMLICQNNATNCRSLTLDLEINLKGRTGFQST